MSSLGAIATRKFQHGSHLVEFHLDRQGCITQIVHQYGSKTCVDDVWQRRAQYRDRQPDFLIQSYLNCGWQEVTGEHLR